MTQRAIIARDEADGAWTVTFVGGAADDMARRLGYRPAVALDFPADADRAVVVAALARLNPGIVIESDGDLT